MAYKIAGHFSAGGSLITGMIACSDYNYFCKCFKSIPA